MAQVKTYHDDVAVKLMVMSVVISKKNAHVGEVNGPKAFGYVLLWPLCSSDEKRPNFESKPQKVKAPVTP